MSSSELGLNYSSSYSNTKRQDGAGIRARSRGFTGSALGASKAAGSLASLLHARRGRELSLHPGHEVKTHHYTHSAPRSHTGYDGVCERGGAAPGSARAGLGTDALCLQADRRQEEDHPVEEIVQREDAVQEKLGQRRGVRVPQRRGGIGHPALVSGTSGREGAEGRDDARRGMRSSGRPCSAT